MCRTCACVYIYGCEFTNVHNAHGDNITTINYIVVYILYVRIKLYTFVYVLDDVIQLKRTRRKCLKTH